MLPDKSDEIQSIITVAKKNKLKPTMDGKNIKIDRIQR